MLKEYNVNAFLQGHRHTVDHVQEASQELARFRFAQKGTRVKLHPKSPCCLSQLLHLSFCSLNQEPLVCISIIDTEFNQSLI